MGVFRECLRLWPEALLLFLLLAFGVILGCTAFGAEARGAELNWSAFPSAPPPPVPFHPPVTYYYVPAPTYWSGGPGVVCTAFG